MYRRRRSIFDIMRDLEAEVEAEVESMLTRIKELELASRCLQPLYEIAEGPDEYVLRVDMPGLSGTRSRSRPRGVSLEYTRPAATPSPIGKV
jgi:HSP20 family molecular chaperone IbpA